MRVKDIKTDLDGQELILRNAAADDAKILLHYLKVTSAETPFLIREPEEITMTIEDERNFIHKQNESPNNLMLVGFLDGEHVGNCSFMGMAQSRYRHRVTIAVALYQKFTGMGIGKVMIEQLIRIAKEHGIEQMELAVVTDNEAAYMVIQAAIIE